VNEFFSRLCAPAPVADRDTKNFYIFRPAKFVGLAAHLRHFAAMSFALIPCFSLPSRVSPLPCRPSLTCTLPPISHTCPISLALGDRFPYFAPISHTCPISLALGDRFPYFAPISHICPISLALGDQFPYFATHLPYLPHLPCIWLPVPLHCHSSSIHTPSPLHLATSSLTLPLIFHTYPISLAFGD
jgi:hypothetical protein